jgi:hypothetical protein
MTTEFYNQCGLEPMPFADELKWKIYENCIEYNRNLQNTEDKKSRPAFVISGVVFSAFFGWLAYRQYKKQNTFWIWFWLIFATCAAGSATVNTVQMIKGS